VCEVKCENPAGRPGAATETEEINGKEREKNGASAAAASDDLSIELSIAAVCPCAVCSGLGNDAASRRGATTATALVRSGSGQSKPTQPPCVRGARLLVCFLALHTARPHVGVRSTARQLRRGFFFFPFYINCLVGIGSGQLTVTVRNSTC